MTRTLDYDVLIIGSGAGGGTVAARLAPLCAQGARIAVLEAGPHYTRADFNMREPDMLRLFLDRGAVPSKHFDIAVTAAQCVGGSTAVYTGVTFRAPEGLVSSWAAEQSLPELSEADIQGRFERIEQEIDAHFPGLDYENENNRVFRKGCEALGLPVKQFRLNLRACERCGFCNLGCPYGAKRGTLEVQLPAAVAQGVELIPNCRVTRVASDGADAVIGAAPEGTQASRHEPGPVRFAAKIVVVAAGTLSSSALLQRSQLRELSPACGRYVTLHPALTSFARMPQPVRGFDGFPKLYYTDAYSESDHYYLETAFYFPFITAKSLPGFGAQPKAFMRSYDHLACTLALVHDDASPDNRLYVDAASNKVVLDYRLSQASRHALVESQKRAGEIYFAAGALEYVSLVSDRFSITSPAELSRAITLESLVPGKVVVSSAHPMGGCRMGSDPRSSVTDAWGEVHGHKGLFVADASVFPTSTKVNPYLTIMAFAERTAERISARLRP